MELLLFKNRNSCSNKKLLKKKVDSLTEQGFENIVLAGHSAGAWASITLKSKFPENIDGVIALNPAVAGTLKNRKEWPWWEDIKNYLINLMELSDLTNELVYSHSKDKFEIPETLFFLSNLSSVKFIDLSTSGCKGEKKFNGYHGITLTECFAKYEETNKNIIQYLESIF